MKYLTPFWHVVSYNQNRGRWVVALWQLPASAASYLGGEEAGSLLEEIRPMLTHYQVVTGKTFRKKL
ncbi:unnamed protein product [Cuscuta campestris]|uniref:Uncharacterized protein n=1 Tax=Cuscuta campestris TaxID=132261 RepID=A0A484M255_9ASTE|nr:unnamed protein product [Cuscuta campestris]